jgi:hypothetical protein
LLDIYLYLVKTEYIKQTIKIYFETTFGQKERKNKKYK